MKHIHHIVPKHAGGTDDPSNLIELSIEEHARAHYILWNKYGGWQDKLAWKGLSGMVGREEMLLAVMQEKRQDPEFRKLLSQRKKQLWQTSSYRDKQKSSSWQRRGLEASLSPEARQKQRDTFKRIEHQKGSKNSQFGKMWITDGIHSYKIDKADSVPLGYRRGRTMKT